MRRGLWLCGMVAMTVGLAGCGSDMREVLVSTAVKQMNDAASNLASIRETVDKWEREKETKDKEKLIKSASETAERLKRNGQNFQEIKQQAEKLEPLSQQDKDELGKSFSKSLRGALDRVTKEMNALNETMARAEKVSKTGIADLRQKLQHAQSEFEVLSRQR